MTTLCFKHLPGKALYQCKDVAAVLDGNGYNLTVTLHNDKSAVDACTGYLKMWYGEPSTLVFPTTAPNPHPLYPDPTYGNVGPSQGAVRSQCTQRVNIVPDGSFTFTLRMGFDENPIASADDVGFFSRPSTRRSRRRPVFRLAPSSTPSMTSPSSLLR